MPAHPVCIIAMARTISAAKSRKLQQTLTGFCRRTAEVGGGRATVDRVHLCPQDWAPTQGGCRPQAALPGPLVQAARWQVCSGEAALQCMDVLLPFILQV